MSGGRICGVEQVLWGPLIFICVCIYVRIIFVHLEVISVFRRLYFGLFSSFCLSSMSRSFQAVLYQN